MTLDPLLPPKIPTLPPQRFAARRDHLLQEIGRGEPVQHAQSHRRRVFFAAAVTALLGIGGAAAAVSGFDLLAELKRSDDRPWSPPEFQPVASRIEVARGPDWSFVAWKSAGGVCLGYAAGTAINWAVSCGRSLNRASERPNSSNYLITLLVHSSESASATTRSAADGRGAIMGAVALDVARVDLEMADGRVLSTLTQSSRGLDASARLFIVREQLRLDRSAIRAVVLYRAGGERLERLSLD